MNDMNPIKENQGGWGGRRWWELASGPYHLLKI